MVTPARPDSASDFATGHEDKRAHAAGTQPSGSSGSGRKGSRNSTGGEEGTGPRTTKDVGKAARRKEQNRAAQKAFRERREAKVRDLEEKIAELEAKSYGASVENENLREILKRLQEENVALRQSAFTFSMPMGGSPVEGRGGTGGNTPNNRANASTAGIKQRQVKPPSPPTSISDDSLKSINDPPVVPHRNSSAMGESPDSLISINSGNGSSSDSAPVNLFNSAPNAFDATAVGGRPSLGDLNSVSSSSGIPSFNGYARSDSGVSPRSSTSNPRTEVDALWADFLQTSPATQAKQSTTKGQGQNQNQTSQPGWSNNNNVAPSPFSLLNSQTNPMSFASNDTKVCGETGNKNAWDKSAFRDESAGAAPFAQVPEPQAQKSQQPQQIQPTQAVQNDPWAGMMGSSVNDFLASLNGVDSNAVGQDADWNTGDDDFNAQLQQLLGTNVSPGAAFNLPNSGGNPFSPTNYLNMSPSPLNSGSNEASPQSQANSGASNSASPESSLGVGSNVSRNDPMGSGVGTLGAAKTDAEQVHLIDETGKILKPSEIWLRMGVQTDVRGSGLQLKFILMSGVQNNLEHLVVDDLCDMMRSKATCKDGQYTPRSLCGLWFAELLTCV